jgi:hypothetical protein
MSLKTKVTTKMASSQKYVGRQLGNQFLRECFPLGKADFRDAKKVGFGL